MSTTGTPLAATCWPGCCPAGLPVGATCAQAGSDVQVMVQQSNSASARLPCSLACWRKEIPSCCMFLLLVSAERANLSMRLAACLLRTACSELVNHAKAIGRLLALESARPLQRPTEIGRASCRE